jgi:hypothetical protein
MMIFHLILQITSRVHSETWFFIHPRTYNAYSNFVYESSVRLSDGDEQNFRSSISGI